MSAASLKLVAPVGALAVATVAGEPAALALQPLGDFLASAKTQSFDQREAKATIDQKEADATQSEAKLFPTLAAKASYTRNQYEAVATLPTGNGTPPNVVTITPLDQLDATFTASLPIVDVGAWSRLSAANASAEGARIRAASTSNDVEKSVTRAYFQVLAAEAAIGAAQKAAAVAEESRQIMLKRREAGSASDLEVERARAQVERAKQVLASAEQTRATARRQLETQTGLKPTDGADPLPEDKLDEARAPSEDVALQQPDVRAAKADLKAADRNATAAWAAFAPTITASATERLTNATGFGGHVASWALVLGAQVTIDPSAYYAAKSQEAQKAAATVRYERTAQRAKDAVFDDGEEVKAQVAKVKAAVAELDANQKAAKLARERYGSGAATQLDVQQADRDVLNAELAKIQAQADLAYARAELKVDTGEGVLAKEGAR